MINYIHKTHTRVILYNNLYYNNNITLFSSSGSALMKSKGSTDRDWLVLTSSAGDSSAGASSASALMKSKGSTDSEVTTYTISSKWDIIYNIVHIIFCRIKLIEGHINLHETILWAFCRSYLDRVQNCIQGSANPSRVKICNFGPVPVSRWTFGPGSGSEIKVLFGSKNRVSKPPLPSPGCK